MELLSLGEIKMLMAKYGIRPSKGLGQNFLIDNNIIVKIIREADIAGKTVVEIGPGLGSLTLGLAQTAKQVLAVELDKKLIPVLKDVVGRFPNVEIINDDALKVNFDNLLKERGCQGSYSVVANLPYYITTPIIMYLLESKFNIEKLVFMVQKEVAGRMMAKPGSKEYGAITLGIQYYTEVSLIAKIPPTVFIPRPEVDSAVIKLLKRYKPPVDICDESFLFALIRAGFSKRRKTLLNSLTCSAINLTRDEVQRACGAAGLNPAQRMEQLTLQEIAALANQLKEGVCN